MIIRENWLKKIRPFYENELIKVLIGIRRCGKSVILKQIYDEIRVDDEHKIFINFEDLQFSALKDELVLYDYIKSQIKDNQKYYLFFDEIQNVANFEKAINSFRLLNTSIFITGSNAKLLSGELATVLSVVMCLSEFFRLLLKRRWRFKVLKMQMRQFLWIIFVGAECRSVFL